MVFPQDSHHESEYSALIDKHKDLAFNIALKITKNEQDSEEIVQDSFVKAFQGLPNFKNDSRFSTWFYKIVYHTAISAIRRKNIDAMELNDSIMDRAESHAMESVTEKMNDKDRTALLSASLARLNETDYTILSLYYYEELGVKEISKVIGKNSNYVKVLLQRARKKLLHSLSPAIHKELKELR
ncbi:MAG: sigma-70 family RNA polymerase sigma factor [Bacteroidales bacterium]